MSRHYTPAIFAASDTQALGVLKAARERGVAVPQQLAVIGFDDVDIAEYIGLTTIRLLTNNPKKVSGLEAYGQQDTQQVPIEIEPNIENRRYLQAKREKLGHRLHHQDLKFEPDTE